MRTLRAAALTALAAIVAAPAPAKPPRPKPQSAFVLESALAPADIVACLSKRAVQPSVLPMERGERVLLGHGNGWIDLLAAPHGSWLKATLMWESPVMTELWVRSCAAGKTPHRGLPQPTTPLRWPGPVTHPG